MLSVLIGTWRQHDHALLILSLAIWTIGSFSLFLILYRSREFALKRRLQWSAISAFTGGIGVWATHFVAMLGHQHAMQMQYGIWRTLLSIVAVIACFLVALRPLSRAQSSDAALYAGTVATVGVGLMHFIGMAAARGVVVHYDTVPILETIAVSWLLFCAAFLLFLRMSGWMRVPLPALFAIIAVAALHFGAMASTTMVMVQQTATASVLDRILLSTAIAVASAVLLVTTAIASVVDRYLSDLRGLADATPDGLAIVHADRMIETNARFAELIGIDPSRLVKAGHRTRGGVNDAQDVAATYRAAHDAHGAVPTAFQFRGLVMAGQLLGGKRSGSLRAEIELSSLHGATLALPMNSRL